MEVESLKQNCCRTINRLLYPKKLNFQTEIETAMFRTLEPDIKKLLMEKDTKLPVPKVIRETEWKGHEKAQTENRFIHRYFSTTILTVDEKKNKKREWLRNEWNETITLEAKEENIKAKQLSARWERDVGSIRRKIQKVAPLSGTVQVPEVTRDNNLFKTSQEKLLNVYTLDGKPYVQFLMEQ